MNLQEAINLVISAAAVRRDQWDAAANEEFFDIIDELYESDIAERQNMAGMITDALRTIQNAGSGTIYSEEQGTTAMAMWEYLMSHGCTKDIRQHFDAGGAAETRSYVLQNAHRLDQAWSVAHEDYGYAGCFDWEFVPDFLWALAILTIPLQHCGEFLPGIFAQMGLEKQEAAE